MSTLKPRRPGLKLVLFGLVSIAVTVTIAATIRPIGSTQPTRDYSALFTNASRLKAGDDVRVAGVRVGTVTDVEVTREARAEVRFRVEKDLALSDRTRIAIRYLNLVGDRYVELADDGSSTTAQNASKLIGTSRTSPALDLNVLLNGFKPLFAALSPADVNSLALDIVKTFQGDGPTVRDLIARTASLTSTLADHDELIGQVIGNLNTTVGLVSAKHQQLEELIFQLSDYASGMARNRQAIGDALGHIDSMAGLSAELLKDNRPALKADIAHLRGIAETLNRPDNTKLVEHALDHLPDKLTRLARTASYGSWFNYYVCSVQVRTGVGTSAIDAQLAKVLGQIKLVDTAARCHS